MAGAQKMLNKCLHSEILINGKYTNVAVKSDIKIIPSNN